jgi:hypothetical protein
MPCPILFGPLPSTIIFFLAEGIDSLEEIAFIFQGRLRKSNGYENRLQKTKRLRRQITFLFYGKKYNDEKNMIKLILRNVFPANY